MRPLFATATPTVRGTALLEISPHSYAQASNHAYGRFQAKCERFVHRHFPEAYAQSGIDAVRIEIDRAVQIAAQQGFGVEADTMRYLYLHFRFGRNFDLDPGYAWFATLLRDRARPPRDRLLAAFDAIDGRVTQRQALHDGGRQWVRAA